MTDIPSVKLRALPSFPVSVNGGAGIAVNKQNGNYSIALSYGNLAQSGTILAPAFSTAFLALWNSANNSYSRISITDLKPAMVAVGSATPEQFGGGTSATAAQNDAAIAACIATGLPVVFPAAGTYNISTAINLPTGTTMRGASMLTTIIRQNSNNTPIVIAGTSFLHVSSLTLQYATPQVAANTASYGLKLDDAGPTGVFLSRFENLAIRDAAIGMGTATYAEFQNNFSCLLINTPSLYGIYFSANSSGSVFDNIRMVGPSQQPATASLTYAIYLQNYDNFTFTQLNIENMATSGTMIYVNAQCSGTFTALHIEQTNVMAFSGAVMQIAGTCDITINNLVYVFNKVAATGIPLFYFYSNAGNIPNRLMLNGFLEHNNTFTNKLPMFGDDGNFNAAYVRGYSTRNGNGICIVNRNNLLQFEGYRFDVAGGRLIGGLAGTTTPAGAMPLPFQSTAGVALGWIVGDHQTNTAMTATTTPGWFCTTAGSPGTWTAEPIL